MKTIRKNVTKAEARKTAFVVASVALVVSAWLAYGGRLNAAAVLSGVAVALLITGAIIPPAAKLFHRWWMTIAFALGYVNSRIILTLVYFLVFVPYRLVSRLAGRDALDIRSPKRESYWQKRARPRQEREQFERLF